MDAAFDPRTLPASYQPVTAGLNLLNEKGRREALAEGQIGGVMYPPATWKSRLSTHLTQGE